MLRKINEMFHVDEEGYLVKTSNGERVPEDEPVFILRGRDFLTRRILLQYVNALVETFSPPDRVLQVLEVAYKFAKFAALHPERMKMPGVTHGK